MPTQKTKPYTKALKETMNRKSEILSKAQALWEIASTGRGCFIGKNRRGSRKPRLPILRKISDVRKPRQRA